MTQNPPPEPSHKSKLTTEKTPTGKSPLNIKSRLSSRFGARGLTRGLAMGVAGANLVGGGVAYGLGDREKEGVESGRR